MISSVVLKSLIQGENGIFGKFKRLLFEGVISRGGKNSYALEFFVGISTQRGIMWVISHNNLPSRVRKNPSHIFRDYWCTERC